MSSRRPEIDGYVGRDGAGHESTGPVGLELEPRGGSAPVTRGVFGDDDRQPIADTGIYPWRAVCWLLITAADGSTLEGSGWLAGPRFVVTAGHCVFQHDSGGWATSIEVVPGRNGPDRRHGSFESALLRSVKGWTRDRKGEFDYGAILLPAPPSGEPAPGDETGWFGYGAVSGSALAATTVNLAGYPDDKADGTLWWHARRIDRVLKNELRYTIDTESGQSGSPLWRWRDDGTRQAVGIHGGQLGPTNQAVRINDRVLANLSVWRSEVT